MAQQNGIEKPDLHALPTISDRMTFIYLEHCKVSRENGAVTATDLDGTVYIPAAAITVLLLGPGTDVSHRAMELIGDMGISVMEYGIMPMAGRLIHTVQCLKSRQSFFLMSEVTLMLCEKCMK